MSTNPTARAWAETGGTCPTARGALRVTEGRATALLDVADRAGRELAVVTAVGEAGTEDEAGAEVVA